MLFYMIMEYLDDGSGVANTIKTKKATYFNGCWALFRSCMLQQQLKKKEIDSAALVRSPKTLLNYKADIDAKIHQCVYCEKYEGKVNEKIYHVSSANCVINLFKWSLKFQNWVKHAQLTTRNDAGDAHATGLNYHALCCTKLTAEACAAKNSSKSLLPHQTYNQFIIAQLLALIKCNNSPQIFLFHQK